MGIDHPHLLALLEILAIDVDQLVFSVNPNRQLLPLALNLAGVSVCEFLDRRYRSLPRFGAVVVSILLRWHRLRHAKSSEILRHLRTC